MDNANEVIEAISIGLVVASFLLNTCRVPKATELCNECLCMFKNQADITDDKLANLVCKAVYWIMFKAYCLIDDYSNAIKCGTKLHDILHKCGERTEECVVSIELATLYLHQRRYAETKEICEKALPTSTAIGDRITEVTCYENLGIVFQSVSEYAKAREYFEKAIAMRRELRDTRGEATACGNLGWVFQSAGEYVNAEEYLRKALEIQIKIGDRKGEATSYRNLGIVYQSVENMTRLENSTRKHWRSEKKLGTDREKGLIMEI